jgi:hypothetical protein
MQKSARRASRKRDFGVPRKKQDNFTDPQSRIMKTTSGYEQCYNGQIAVDEDWQLIVATALTNNAADNNELLPLIDEALLNLGRGPEQILADAGYRSEANFQVLEERNIDAYVSLGREGKKAPTVATTPASQRMEAKLATEAGKKRYRRRKAIVEPVFGWIKSVLGFRSFSFRGQEKTEKEWNLVCLAVNLKRFHVLQAASRRRGLAVPQSQAETPSLLRKAHQLAPIAGPYENDHFYPKGRPLQPTGRTGVLPRRLLGLFLRPSCIGRSLPHLVDPWREFPQTEYRMPQRPPWSRIESSTKPTPDSRRSEVAAGAPHDAQRGCPALREGQLDFVYIDAQHHYEAARRYRDLVPKVRKGGYCRPRHLEGEREAGTSESSERSISGVCRVPGFGHFCGRRLPRGLCSAEMPRRAEP